MKVRDSGMPEQAFWESLFDIALILDTLGIDSGTDHVAELGCGYGTFTVPVAQRIGGRVSTFDIDPEMVEITVRRAQVAGLQNVSCRCRDVCRAGFGLESASQSAVLLFNILHCEDQRAMLEEAARILRPGGAVLAMHWRSDIATPRGPSLDIRPRPETIRTAASNIEAFEPAMEECLLPPWHFGMVIRKRSKPDEPR